MLSLNTTDLIAIGGLCLICLLTGIAIGIRISIGHNRELIEGYDKLRNVFPNTKPVVEVFEDEQ